MSIDIGFDAQAPSLPQGGGAVGGLGETFSPDLSTGTGSFAILDFEKVRSVAYSELLDGAMYIQDPDDVATYRMAAESVQEFPVPYGIDPHLTVFTCRHHAPAVARELETEHSGLVASQHIHEFVLAEMNNNRVR